MDIKKVLKRIIGKPQWKKALYDDVIYENDMESFSGNSLSNSNILILADESLYDKIEKAVKHIEKIEKCDISLIKSYGFNGLLNEEINKIGGYDHIINCCIVNKDDDVYRIYSLLQEETNYLVDRECYSTVCTMIFAENPNSSNVIAIKGILEGLGEVLPNHNIIENGAIVSGNLLINEAIQTALFLSGKYGQLLTGFVVEMGA